MIFNRLLLYKFRYTGINGHLFSIEKEKTCIAYDEIRSDKFSIPLLKITSGPIWTTYFSDRMLVMISGYHGFSFLNA